MPAAGQGAAWLQRANALLDARDLAASEAALRQAERSGARATECAGTRWFLSMLRGDFERAWQASDLIRAQGGADPHRFWEGEELTGKRVIVRSLHGFGDAVQMLRLLPEVRARAARVVLQVAPGLVELAGCFAGSDEVVTWAAAGAPEPSWEVQVEVMELPYLLRLQADKLPWAATYLQLPEKALRRTFGAVDRVNAPGRRALRVGVVWAAGDWNPSRTLPVPLLAVLLELAEHSPVEFWSLQGPGATPEAGEYFASGVLRDGTELTTGALALAATVASMDLIVSVDTLAAHLAGALGRPVWLLLQEHADWRWMVDRDDSPWYPTMRLFRCRNGEGWGELMPRVRCALADLLQAAKDGG